MKRLAAPVCLPLCFWKTVPNLLYWKETPSEKIPPKRSWRYTARRDLRCMTCLTDMKRFLLSAAHHSWRRFHKWTAERERDVCRQQTRTAWQVPNCSSVWANVSISGKVRTRVGNSWSGSVSQIYPQKKQLVCNRLLYWNIYWPGAVASNPATA